MGEAARGTREDLLLEREDELGRAGALLDSTRQGSGHVLLVEGEAGIGKTRLLRAACEMARQKGFEVLGARGGELERDLPFGVARQLFEPALRRAAVRDRDQVLQGAAALALGVVNPTADQPESGAPTRVGDVGAKLHGLYWLAANLAEDRSYVLAVDDLHWCDRESLRFLSYLSRRLEGVPILALLAARPAEPGSHSEFLDALAAEPDVDLVRPAPLSEKAASRIIRSQLGEQTGEELCAACARVTGGNPFLLEELLRAVDDLRPEAVPSIGPPAISRSVLGRVGRLGDSAVALARAIAVLDVDAELRHAAAVAELDLGAATVAADALTIAQVIAPERPLRFLHPVMRTAVYEDLAPGMRARMHGRAAAALAASQGPADKIGSHLLSTEPEAARWVVDALIEASREAQARGAPALAARYLRRALSEPPAPSRRPTVVSELGIAEMRTGAPEAVARLEEALSLFSDTGSRARLAQQLALALLGQGKAARALERLIELIDELDGAGVERELILSLEARATAIGQLDMGSAELINARLARFETVRGETPGERMLLAMLAARDYQNGTAAGKVVDLAERALAGGRLLRELTSEDPVYYQAIWPLIVADRLETAERALADAQADAARRGVSAFVALPSAVRATIAHRRGELAIGEAHARTAVEVSGEQGELVVPVAVGYLAEIVLDRGRVDEAVGVLDNARLPDPLPDWWFYNPVLFARARVRLAQGAHDEAVADLREMQRRHDAWHALNPVGVPWRLPLAVALADRGDAAGAEQLVAELHDLAARWGTPRALGLAELAEALIATGARRIDLLRRAAAALEGSPGRLDRARTLIELGAALRRANQRSAAREPLRSGLDLARRCGAASLAARARDELVAAGARPRRELLTGVEALTPSERRVADMAASGMTNREIAQALFVTMKTVAVHLTHSYQKLGIESRTELPEALAREPTTEGERMVAQAG